MIEQLVREIESLKKRIAQVEMVPVILTAPDYGSCYGNEIAWTQASAVQNTWYPISDADMADGQLRGVTHDGSGKLTLQTTGRYLCTWNASVEVSLVNKHLQLGIGITPDGGSISVQSEVNHIEVTGAAAQATIGGNLILNASALSTVEVVIRTTDTGTPNLSVDHLMLSVYQIGASPASQPDQWTWLTAPLTSTSWDGDAYSTTAKTLIDLSSVFGVPAGVKAVLVYLQINDAASSTTDCYIFLSPNSTAVSGMAANTQRAPNDYACAYCQVIPCDANGDIYYQIAASGAGTFDVKLEIWGYLL